MTFEMTTFTLNFMLLIALLYTANFLDTRTYWGIKGSYFLLSIGVLCNTLRFIPTVSLVCSPQVLETLADILTPLGMLLILLLDRRSNERGGDLPRFWPGSGLE